jgi:hypothetical protein
MNRIREALKGAEPERARARGGHAESAAVVDPLPAEPATGAETSPPADTRAGVVAVKVLTRKPGRVSCTRPFTSDTLLARCPPISWNPDPKTMFFFCQEENTRSTEQFRTLCSRLYQMRDEVVGQKILLTSAWPLSGHGKASQNLNFEKLVREADELYTELLMEYEDK